VKPGVAERYSGGLDAAALHHRIRHD